MHLDVGPFPEGSAEFSHNAGEICLGNAADDAGEVGIVGQEAVRGLYNEVGCPDFSAIRGEQLSLPEGLLLERGGDIDAVVLIQESFPGCVEIIALYKVIFQFSGLARIEEHRAQGGGDRVADKAEFAHCLVVYRNCRLRAGWRLSACSALSLAHRLECEDGCGNRDIEGVQTAQHRYLHVGVGRHSPDIAQPRGLSAHYYCRAAGHIGVVVPG